jgi:ABC-2 type transport system ATP-binding protein
MSHITVPCLFRASPDCMPDTVQLTHVTKRYDGHVAVSDLSLTVPAGTVYGLLGPNGAGKTTTIRMILNLIAPDSGSVQLFGQANSAGGVIDRVGYLPEERGLYKKMQVRRVLRFLAELKGVSRRDADRRIDQWLDRLQLRTAERDWGNAKVDELSRGMQQKVQFIATLLHDPELVILDEPFSGLDPINAEALKDTILELRQRGRTVIFSTHLMDSAQQLCDAVCIIAGGRKVLDGDVSAVRASHGGRSLALAFAVVPPVEVLDILRDRTLVERADHSNRSAEIELARSADPQVLLRRLLDAGARIERYELLHPSLHQVFLDMVDARWTDPGLTE